MAHVGFYATGMIVSTQVSKANRGIVALVSGLVLTFAFSGAAINYGSSHVQGLFWLFFPFWNAQTFINSEYGERSPPYDVALLNDPDSDLPNNKFDFGYDLDSSFLRNVLLAALTGMIVLRCYYYQPCDYSLPSFLLLSLAFAWHVLALAFLKFSDWRKQR